MTFEDLRDRVSSILGVRVPPKGFESVAMERDTQGALAHRQLIRIIIAMYTYLEATATPPVEVPAPPKPEV